VGKAFNVCSRSTSSPRGHTVVDRGGGGRLCPIEVAVDLLQEGGADWTPRCGLRNAVDDASAVSMDFFDLMVDGVSVTIGNGDSNTMPVTPGRVYIEFSSGKKRKSRNAIDAPVWLYSLGQGPRYAQRQTGIPSMMAIPPALPSTKTAESAPRRCGAAYQRAAQRGVKRERGKRTGGRLPTAREYSGIEHEVVDGVVQSIKLITKRAAERVLRFGFQYAQSIDKKHGRAVHKARGVLFDLILIFSYCIRPLCGHGINTGIFLFCEE
jgi:hypothetical protein